MLNGGSANGRNEIDAAPPHLARGDAREGIEMSELLAWFAAVQVHKVMRPKGTLLFLQGESPFGIYIILKGLVRLSLAGKGGKFITCKLAGNGEILGASAVFMQTEQEFNAETIRPSEFFYVSANNFLEAASKNREIYDLVMRQVILNCQSLCETICLTALETSVDARLRRFKNQAIFKSLTHREIGEHIGSTRETVCRHLKLLGTSHGATPSKVSGQAVETKTEVKR
jgi:CRP-like cAMP-binding protein